MAWCNLVRHEANLLYALHIGLLGNYEKGSKYTPPPTIWYHRCWTAANIFGKRMNAFQSSLFTINQEGEKTGFLSKPHVKFQYL
jgi:hypothetical protein